MPKPTLLEIISNNLQIYGALAASLGVFLSKLIKILK
jgi:hypothetical protein